MVFCLEDKQFQIANEPAYVRSTKQWWALGIVTFLVLVMLLVAVMFLVKQRRKSKRQDEQLRALYNQLMGESVRDYILGPTDPKHPLHERVESLPYDRKFEISRDKLSFEKVHWFKKAVICCSVECFISYIFSYWILFLYVWLIEL